MGVKSALLGLLLAAGCIPAASAPAAGAKPAAKPAHHPVLLISIDGLRPGDVIEADRRGLKIPALRALLAEGAHAGGVVGVLPTLTYPSHTTLITGVDPAHHGVVNNLTFDPTAMNQDGWYWYAADLKAPTLWDAARARGLTTGNVHWPVSVGAKIGWNLPQIWRTGHEDDAKLLAALATPGLLPELEAKEGPYAPGKAEDLPADQTRGRFAARMIAAHHPDFLTVYLAALDHTEHETGPDSAASHAVLEGLDAIVGQLIAAERKAHPDAVIAVVSDHGFAPVDNAFNLSRALIDAGLIRLSAPDPLGRQKIESWDAVAWASGGSVAVVLARPDDAALVARVRDLLLGLKGDPANRITDMLEGEAIAKAGGNPQASFYLNLAPPMLATGFIAPGLPLRFVPPTKGMHGFFPGDPRMRSTFVIAGPGVPKGRDLGEIDMRVIAPTLARIMGARLDQAEAPAITF
ncbi:alkaline phosphatase family protein [Novosphingobium sediminicola]|uniref:Putative AlkP superfamily pyrophosphatase or phosphodiesterase n=1 Tax=Novosphingobium sediminicola TaxID=563162 RepID=A0A7W6G6H8_9SPHN|nr:ectonucleotide pyrophosphatase/phosphodiesterase [Novosphingobium sediminicola]MBB3955318.1 putative AlkP superfamily pyrophosphatase or phosphodiesterase [Novosphingobium sediminicola]